MNFITSWLYPVELHTHLECECPPGVVVRRCGRRAGIGKDVRVHLRFEHVHHVRAKRLHRKDYERSRWIVFASGVERA